MSSGQLSLFPISACESGSHQPPSTGGFLLQGGVDGSVLDVTSVAPARADVDVVLAHGSIHTSPGGQYSFRVIGSCCRLFDREELPWPCCRLAWRSKEPSWRRVGRRFVADVAARRCPSYVVELLQPGSKPTVTVLTLFSQRLTPGLQEWWYSRGQLSKDPANLLPASMLNASEETPSC